MEKKKIDYKAEKKTTHDEADLKYINKNKVRKQIGR